MKPFVRYRFSEGSNTSDAKPEHMAHIQTAHNLLAEVVQHKTTFGLEQFRRTITLSDGTTITALASIGFTDIKINVPKKEEPPPEEKPQSEEKPQPKEKPEKKEDEEKEEEGDDYLWIGIRPVQPINSEAAGLDGAYSVCGLLIEPDGVHTLLGDAGFDEHGSYMTYNNAGTVMTDPGSFMYDDLESYRANEAAYEAWKTLPVGFEPLCAGYRVGEFTGGFRFSSGGVIGYDVVQNAYSLLSGDPMTVSGTMLPIDPKVPMLDARHPEGQLGTPANPDAWWGDAHWHNVFLLDPTPANIPLGNQPLRPQDGHARAVVAKTIDTLYGNSIRVKTGDYILKVCMYGNCRPNKGAAIQVEIEVRVGKPYAKSKTEFIPQTTFKTTATVDWWSGWARSVLPYGGRYGDNAELGSPNPHGPMWWQGGLTINVKNRTVREDANLVPSVDIGMDTPMFVPGEWDGQNDVCTALVWYPYMLSSFAPGTVPIGTGLENQAHSFARTYYYATWYAGDQGWTNPASFDWTRYNLAPLISAIVAYAISAGRTDLNGTKIIASGYPADQGTRSDPVITILEMSTTTSTEWTDLVNSGQIYNGTFHHMRAVF